MTVSRTASNIGSISNVTRECFVSLAASGGRRSCEDETLESDAFDDGADDLHHASLAPLPSLSTASFLSHIESKQSATLLSIFHLPRRLSMLAEFHD
jgi:hypothetical protein